MLFLVVFWDTLYSVSVGICGTLYTLFRLVFLRHTLYFYRYFWDTLYNDLLVFVGHSM
jgi:hypothetical protein